MSESELCELWSETELELTDIQREYFAFDYWSDHEFDEFQQVIRHLTNCLAEIDRAIVVALQNPSG